jgi:oligopeptide transport system substrate-binding protein
MVLAGVLASTMSLTGCGSSTSSNKTTAKLTPDKNQEVTVSIPVGDVQTLDASKGTDAYSAYILQESMEALAREEVINGKDVFVPDGASSWNVSSDGKTWTFHLRASKWSDGKAVTADQYVYSIKRTLNPATASQYAYLLTGANIVGAANYNSGKGNAAQVGVKAINPLTLQITLTSPCAYFEKLLSNKLFVAQREDMVNKYGARYGITSQSLVYNGPFEITNFDNGNKVVMAKNPDYWDNKSVKLNTLTFLFMGDENARMNAFMSGEIDQVPVLSDNWKNKFEQGNKYNENTIISPITSYVFFNTKNKYFKNVDIRKAFSLAIDRNEYVKVVRQGIGKPAFGWVPPSVLVGTTNFRSKVPEELVNSTQNLKQLLATGLKQIGANPDPSKMSITYLESGTDELSKEDGDFMINQFKTKLGVNINVNYMEWAQYNAEVTKGAYDMSTMAWGADYNDPMTFLDMFETGANVVTNYWSDKTYDALIADAGSTMNETRRLADFQKAENILVNTQAVIAPTYYQQFPIFTSKIIQGVQEPVFAPYTVEWKYAYTVGRK